MPEYLYHYTSVDVLELILKNKTIRFNPLTKMDDPLEQWSKHGRQEGSMVFISSWTDAEEEIAKMWTDYCRPDVGVGVRIRLPKNPFSLSKNILPDGNAETLAELISVQKTFIWKTLQKYPENIMQHKTMLEVAMAQNKNGAVELNRIINEIEHKYVVCHTKDLNSILKKVEYTDDKDKIYPEMYIDYMGEHLEFYHEFGVYKDPTWAWQKEWRYRLHFRMFTPGIRHHDGTIDLYPLPFNYYDLILDEERIKDMQIMLSPVITDEAKDKVKRIVREYNPTAEIVFSNLDELD